MRSRAGYILDIGLASGTLAGYLIGTVQDRVGIGIAIGATGGYLIGWLLYCVFRPRRKHM